MPKLDIQLFEEAHIGDAAGLLERRHEAHRRVEPLLPKADAPSEVRAASEADSATGWTAFQDGVLVGFLIGSPRDGRVWGEGNVWVELAGHAVAEPELVRDLYAVAADTWVDAGMRRHYAIVPATDRELVDAWFRLSFGAQHAQGIREVPDAAAGNADFVVRHAGDDDAEIAARLDRLLPDFQARSPVFASGAYPGWEELIAEYAERVEHDEAILLVEHNGRTVGLLTVADVSYSGMHSGLSRPERAAVLGLATTLPEVRGSGAGVALTEACFAWAREHGYETIVVDWRETNLRSSRFWPNRGFRRTFQRLYRAIH